MKNVLKTTLFTALVFSSALTAADDPLAAQLHAQGITSAGLTGSVFRDQFGFLPEGVKLKVTRARLRALEEEAAAAVPVAAPAAPVPAAQAQVQPAPAQQPPAEE